VFQQYALRYQQQQVQALPLQPGQELQQGTEAWLRLREGRLTASATAEAAGFFSIGTFADRIMSSGWPSCGCLHMWGASLAVPRLAVAGPCSCARLLPRARERLARRC
jgi:hypothetical protein